MCIALIELPCVGVNSALEVNEPDAWRVAVPGADEGELLLDAYDLPSMNILLMRDRQQFSDAQGRKCLGQHCRKDIGCCLWVASAGDLRQRRYRALRPNEGLHLFLVHEVGLQRDPRHLLFRPFASSVHRCRGRQAGAALGTVPPVAAARSQASRLFEPAQHGRVDHLAPAPCHFSASCLDRASRADAHSG